MVTMVTMDTMVTMVTMVILLLIVSSPDPRLPALQALSIVCHASSALTQTSPVHSTLHNTLHHTSVLSLKPHQCNTASDLHCRALLRTVAFWLNSLLLCTGLQGFSLLCSIAPVLAFLHCALHSGLKWGVRWGVSQIWPKTQF